MSIESINMLLRAHFKEIKKSSEVIFFRSFFLCLQKNSMILSTKVH